MHQLIALRNILLLVIVTITCFAVPVSQRLTFDQSIESFFSPDNPDIRLLQRSRRDFGGDEFVIVAWRESDLVQRVERDLPELSETAAARITSLADQLNAVPGIDPARTRHLVRYLEKAPRSRNTRSAMLKLFRGMLIGHDGRTTAIILQLLPEREARVPRKETLGQIRRIATEFDPDVAVAGEAVQIFDMFDLVERDGQRLYLVSLLTLSAVLLLIFGGIRWTAAPIGIVMATVVCTRAALVVSHAQLSMVGSMLNSLVTVISVATTTHIIVHYRELRTLLPPRPAAEQTLRELWQPVFWSIVTTVVGFSALLVSDIVPVRSFAFMMAAATGMVLVCTVCVVPAMLCSGTAVPLPGRAPLETSLDRLLKRLAQSIEDHPLTAGLVCVVAMAVTAPGLFLLSVETDFSRNFRRSSPIVRSLEFVESSLGGAGTWEVAFDVPEEVSVEFLDQTRALTDRLQQLTDSGVDIAVVSLNDAIDMPPRLGNAPARLERLRKRQPDLIESFYNPALRRMRIVLRSREQQPADAKLFQIQQVRDIVQQHFRQDRSARPDAADPKDAAADLASGATASGLFVLLAHLIESLLQDQLTSFLIAGAGILVCMTIAFRSLRIGLISLLPNIFPVVLVTGGMGVLQIPINIGTAMIASVSMGLTVDSSIHYITEFERARRTHTIRESLRIAHGGAGRATVLAHLALVCGFMVLTASEFIPLVYFGALLSLSMVGALVGTLVLLPLLLRWTTPRSGTPLPTASEQS